MPTERIAVDKAAKADKMEAIIKAGGTPPVNNGGMPTGIPNKVTPTVTGMNPQMKAKWNKVMNIPREPNLSCQSMYEMMRAEG